ncbi:MAG TPA: hypothetical protein VFB59_01640 [Candidatus Saccharimonadales bacterium]|nr:hypothetical protein [Candidatus Saccharimonadales bacterium]
MQQKGFSAIEAVIILVVLGVLGLGGWWVYQANTKTSQTTQSTQATESEKQSNGQDTEQTAYSNADLGIAFEYPKEWGDVVVEPGAPSGVLLGFSKNHSVVFGSYASMQNRSMTIYDFDGYTKEGSSFYFNAGSTKDAINPKAIVTAKNSDILVVDNNSFDSLKNYFDVGILKSQDYEGSDLAGLVNVKTSYKGVVFINQQKRASSPFDTSLSTGQIPQAEFEKLLATVNVL